MIHVTEKYPQYLENNRILTYDRCLGFLGAVNGKEWEINSHWRYSIKKAVPKNFAIFTGKHLCWSPFFVKLQTLQFHQKENPKQVFSCEYCQI